MLIIRQYFLLRQLCFLNSLLAGYLNYVVLNRHNLDLNFLTSALVQIAELCKKQWYLRYQTTAEITAIDYPHKVARFRLVYVLLSYVYSVRIVLATSLAENTVVSSLTSIFKGACWQEREIWDLFGIFFRSNPDLRRILTDYGFFGHPLRKDFPLTGFYEVLYDDRKKQILYRPVSLAQEYRSMYTVNPWVFIKKNNFNLT